MKQLIPLMSRETSRQINVLATSDLFRYLNTNCCSHLCANCFCKRKIFVIYWKESQNICMSLLSCYSLQHVESFFSFTSNKLHLTDQWRWSPKLLFIALINALHCRNLPHFTNTEEKTLWGEFHPYWGRVQPGERNCNAECPTQAQGP